MAIDESIRELLDTSTDIQSVAAFAADGALLAFGPGAVASDTGAAVARLWEAAARRAAALGAAPLDHVVVPVEAGSVAIVARAGRLIAASTGPEPAVGLLLFDLRTCLADAFDEEAPS